MSARVKSPSPAGSVFSNSRSPSVTSLEYSKVYNSEDEGEPAHPKGRRHASTTTISNSGSGVATRTSRHHYASDEAEGSVPSSVDSRLYHSDPDQEQFLDGSRGGAAVAAHGRPGAANSISRSRDVLESLASRTESRIERMFHPLLQANVRPSATRAHRLHPTLRSQRNRYVRQQLLRNSRREALKENYRGNMEDFVLRSEEDRMHRQMERDAELQAITDPDDVDDDEHELEYDADDDDDLEQRKRDAEQEQLREMLEMDRLELEEMTRNLNLG